MQTILAIFREIHDPRDFNARHDVAAMLFLALAATLCGAKSSVGIADFAEANEEELAKIVDLPHGAPSHDSFSRLFRLLDPVELAQALTGFAQALRKALGLDPAKGVVAIDGKRLRRGYEKGRSFLPPLMVSVWDAETRLSLATRGTNNGDEVGASLAALKTLDLKGCIVTGDALHCHPAMATAVRERGAHYAFKLKANHGPLFTCAKAAFAAADASGKLQFFECTNDEHGRHERRRASIIALPDDAPAFPDLSAIGRIEAERSISGGKASNTVHYVVLSKKLPARRLLEVVRGHWSVENELHWRLDVVFNEDDARTRKNNAPQNLGVLRRMALDILRAHPDTKSVARKMSLAAWKKEYFYELFAYW